MPLAQIFTQALPTAVASHVLLFQSYERYVDVCATADMQIQMKVELTMTMVWTDAEDSHRCQFPLCFILPLMCSNQGQNATEVRRNRLRLLYLREEDFVSNNAGPYIVSKYGEVHAYGFGALRMNPLAAICLVAVERCSRCQIEVEAPPRKNLKNAGVLSHCREAASISETEITEI